MTEAIPLLAKYRVCVHGRLQSTTLNSYGPGAVSYRAKEYQDNRGGLSNKLRNVSLPPAGLELAAFLCSPFDATDSLHNAPFTDAFPSPTSVPSRTGQLFRLAVVPAVETSIVRTGKPATFQFSRRPAKSITFVAIDHTTCTWNLAVTNITK